jgi:hypothetical protein
MSTKTISPFSTKTYPALFDMPADSTVSIVGNSGLMLTKEWGAAIDKSDIVVRFNHAPTRGFEKYVGSKTSLRVVNGHCFAGTTNTNENPTASPDFLPSLPPQDIYCKTFNFEEFYRGIMNNVNKHNLFFSNPEFLATVGKYTPGQEPTAGLIGMFLLLPFFDQINVYGFTFWENTYDYHYFEKVPVPASQIGHSFNVEKDIVNQLEVQKRIIVHR